MRKLAAGPAMVGELNELFDMSAPAVSRHLRLLEAAGLIQRTRHGTFHGIALNPAPLESVRAFLGELEDPAAAPKKRNRPKPAPEPMVWDPEEDEIAKLL